MCRRHHTECSRKAIRNGYGHSCALVCCRIAGTSFCHNKRPIIRLRSLRAQAVYLPTNVRGPISHYRDGSVGVTAACRALCGLLCLPLWTRPERADELPGTTGTRLLVLLVVVYKLQIGKVNLYESFNRREEFVDRRSQADVD